MDAWITAHAGMVFALMAIAGAALHWAKKAYRREVTWNPIDYWFADNPIHSAGAAGALVVAVWAVVFSDSLTGMQAHMVVASGFTLGWMLDSGLNKPAGGSLPAGSRSGGFVRLQLLPWLAIGALAVMMGGCANLGGPQRDSFDKVATDVEIGLREGYALVETLARAEVRARAAGAAPGSVITRDKASAALQVLDVAKAAFRVAQDARLAQEPCVGGVKIEALGLKGCVSPDTVMVAALRSITQARQKLEGT